NVLSLLLPSQISTLFPYTTLFRSDNNATYILKQLRRGDFEPELFLDLHGLTRAQAKREIAALLNACQREHVSCCAIMSGHGRGRSEEHTSELQSREKLVCRLLLEK